jgi:RNA polymerase sigma factor (TIGR02999 family)
MEPTAHEVTNLLLAWSGGDKDAFQRLVPRVYDHLRKLASGFLFGERSHHELHSAALVNETYLRLVELDRIRWQDRAHFFALCARFMRRILIDHARTTTALKRGAAQARIAIGDLQTIPGSSRPTDLIALEDALTDLADRDPEAARVVELRFFGGMNRDEIAEALGLSSATVTRRWRMARAWLFEALRPQADEASAGV